MATLPPEPALAPAELDSRLAANPVDLTALLAKADWSLRAGDRRSAGALYAAAAGSPDRDHSQASPDRVRAAQASMALQRAYVDHMMQTLSAAGFGRSQWHSRFAKALDIMTGQRPRNPVTTAWPQMPGVFFYPDLPDIDFIEADPDWAGEVEAATGAIASELDALRGAADAFEAYVSGQSGAAQNDYHGMLGNRDWSSLHLVENGARKARPASATLVALDAAPLCEIDGRTPSVLFSRLTAGAHIPPHTGMLNFRAICHLPIIVPGNGEIRVGGARRTWEKGKLLVFDDSVEHEAWNRSQEERIVLIFDIWKPEIEDIEKAQLRTLFGTVDSF
ncbi:aspartyl/asparaginyl beta-hydroxylase domain-containing protein [Altererythrobacter sp. MTPC7]|uniref:aspartyl/asparaginyl beta-hydroxylase domain-containing protein n=1 Tax=Altererythrobacter sp. MTPC7 TaxID=3056567 RepID=UPI0036F3D16F